MGKASKASLWMLASSHCGNRLLMISTGVSAQDVFNDHFCAV
jgi:hypothetical protein